MWEHAIKSINIIKNMNGKLSKVKILFLIFLIVGTFFILRNRTPEIYTTNSGYIFGTQYNIKYKSVEDLHEEIKATMMQVDNSLSMFNKSSIISAFNSNRDTIANEMFTEVFNLAQEISAKTDGAFDITVGYCVPVTVECTYYRALVEHRQ